MTHRFPWFRLRLAWLLWWGVGLGFALGARETAPLPDEYSLDVWQVEDGLPDNSVNSIVQTPDGYLWFGTFNGLVRFDGIRFQRMDANAPGMESGRVVQLFLDRQGALWIAMEYGQITRYADGKFTVLGAASGWLGARARHFSEDAAGRVLVSSSEGGLFRFEGQRFARLLPDESGPAIYGLNLSGGAAQPVRVRRGDVLGTIEADRWVPMVTPDGGGWLQTTGWGENREGGLWVDTGGRIKLLRNGQWAADFGAQPWPTNIVIKFMHEDSRTNLWVGTWKDGLFRFTPEGGVSHYSTRNGFPNDTLRCLHEDREGNLWLGTDGAGLIRLKRRIFQSHDIRQGLPAGGLTTLAEDRQAGHLQGALKDQVFEWRGDQWQLLPKVTASDPAAAVFSVLFDHAGRRWLGTYGQGVFRVAADGWKQWTAAEGLISSDVLSLFEDRAGAIWIGTEAGLSRFADGRFTHYTTTNGLPSNVIRVLTEDRDGNLWIGTTGGGLSRFQAGKFTTFSRADGLPGDSIRSLLADEDGTLWVGTSGRGLAWWHDGYFSAFTTEEGLPDNEIAAILDDRLGHLWLGSNHGVFRVSRQELAAVAQGGKKQLEGITYLGGDGLASAQVSGGHIAGLRAGDGRLWFATSRGASVVDPRQIRLNPVPPPVMIEEALADGARLDPVSRHGAEPTLQVPPGTSRTEIHYTALSLTNPERNRFRFQLEGYDSGWIEAGVQRVAYYTKVPPGTHRFRVLAANSDGVWNETGTAVVVTFRPAWWQTWSFRVAAGLGLLGLVFAAYHFRVQRLKRARAQQEEFSRRLLASQEAERARIAGELHDSLGQNLLVIKSRVTLAQQQAGQPAKLSEQLAEAAAITSEAIREVREISQNLRPFQLDELGLTKALAAMVRKLEAASPIRFHCELAELRGIFTPEHEINLYRIVQECLNNVVKHSQATRCGITATRKADGVELVVADNGRGFAAHELLAHGVARDGFGLSGIAERVRTLGGRVEFMARPGEGTCVTISIPLSK